MFYVYLLRSVEFPHQKYVGFTTNLKQRLTAHNSGSSFHTAKYRPWKLVTVIGFTDQHKALEFEKYLKSSSGRAFSEKRLL